MMSRYNVYFVVKLFDTYLHIHIFDNFSFVPSCDVKNTSVIIHILISLAIILYKINSLCKLETF